MSTDPSSAYLTIDAPAEGILRDRGSKHIGLVYPIRSKEEALALIQEARDAHPKANHHCFAWRLGADGSDYRQSDDGEPSGSAGRPMLNALRSAELTQVLAIVVRYFGGTKLGVPGLIAAYEGAVKSALEGAKVVERRVRAIYEMKCTYACVAQLRQQFGKHGAQVIDEGYDNTHALFTFSLPKSEHEKAIPAIVKATMALHSMEQWTDEMDAELSWTFKSFSL